MNMNKLFILAFSVVLFSSCAVTSINVITRNAPTKPASKLLVVYLDEGCDLSLFDSDLYTICLRSCFRNPATMNQRSHIETILAENLATPRSSVLKASDLFDSVNSSYTYFRRCIDSLGIDGILVAGLRSYSHIEHAVYVPGSRGGLGYTDKYNTLDGAFACYLFDTRSMKMPIWTAEVGGKGKRFGSKNGLNRSMAQKVATGLKASGYITH
jgi:hypothetical protein